MYKNVSILI